MVLYEIKTDFFSIKYLGFLKYTGGGWFPNYVQPIKPTLDKFLTYSNLHNSAY